MRILRHREGLLVMLLAAGAGTMTAVPDPAAAEYGEAGPCVPTVENIEGPYYLPGAPFRDRVVPPGASGRPLVLMGRVIAADCVTPLSGAVVDLWQTDAAGKYDFSGEFRWRGRVRTDADGRYRIETVIPGRYRAGLSYRPSHIHLKVSHPGGRTLITQVYFEDDPHLRDDPFVKRSLVIPLRRDMRDEGETWSGTFDVVLAPREGP